MTKWKKFSCNEFCLLVQLNPKDETNHFDIDFGKSVIDLCSKSVLSQVFCSSISF